MSLAVGRWGAQCHDRGKESITYAQNTKVHLFTSMHILSVTIGQCFKHAELG